MAEVFGVLKPAIFGETVGRAIALRVVKGEEKATDTQSY